MVERLWWRHNYFQYTSMCHTLVKLTVAEVAHYPLHVNRAVASAESSPFRRQAPNKYGDWRLAAENGIVFQHRRKERTVQPLLRPEVENGGPVGQY